MFRSHRTVVGGLLVAIVTLSAQSPLLVVGQPMPDAEVVNLEGTPVHLRSLIGKKPVLIEFWATWCGVCKALKPRLEAAQAKYGDRVEFIVLAVSANQTRSEVSDYVKAHGLPGRPLYDSHGAAMAAFGVAGTGYVFLMKGEGRVSYAGAGPNQDLDAAIASMVTSHAR